MKRLSLRLLPALVIVALNSVSAADLVWTGLTDANWDTTTLNWRLAAAPFTPTTYTNGDTATFDDTGLNVSIAIGTPVTPGTITVNTSVQDYTFTGVIGGTATSALVKTGLSTLTLSGANTFTGAITVNGGILATGNASGLGINTATALITLDGGTTLRYTGTGTLVTLRSLVLGISNVTVDVTAATGFLQIGGDSTLGTTTGVSMTGSAPAGSLQLTKTGPGMFGNNNNLQPANFTTKYAGDTALLNGTLQSASASTNENAFFGTGNIFLGDNTGSNSVTFSAGSGTTTLRAIPNNFIVQAGNTGTATLVTTNGSTIQQFAGTITLNNHDLRLRGGQNGAGLQFNAAVSGTGNLVVQNNALTTNLSNTQPFSFKNALNLTGSITVLLPVNGLGTARAANVQINAANESVSESIILNPKQIFSLNGFSASVGSLVGDGLVVNNGATLATLTIGSDNTSQVFTGALQNNSGSGAGAFALTKEGTGSQTLGGISTYTGATTTNAGSLIVDGSLAAGSAVSIAAGALLRGNAGTVSGTVTTVAGAIIAPGEVVGTTAPKGILTIGTFNPTAGGTVDIRVSNPAAVLADKLNVSASSALDLSTATLLVQSEAGNYAPSSQVVVFETTAGNFITAPFGTVQKGSNVTVAYLDAADAVVAVPSGSTPAAKVRLTLTNGVTPVRLEAFSARPEGAGVLLTWNAISEFQNAGFNVYRRSAGTRAWIRANPTLILGRITHADTKSYAYYDWTLPGVYDYKLESVSLASIKETYPDLAGPVVSGEFNTPTTMAGGSVEAAAASIAMHAAFDRSEIISAGFTPTARARIGSVRIVPSSMKSESRIQSGSASKLIEPTVSASARWFTSAPARSSSFVAAKIMYQTPGVMLIPQAMLPAGFNIRHMAIQREGRSLNALALTADGLLVFGAGYQDDYTDKDALFLRNIASRTNAGEVTHAQGLFAAAQPPKVTSSATATVDFHDVYFDFNLRPYTFTPWFSGQYLTSGSTQTFTLETPNATANAAMLTINLWSVTQSDAATADHALQVTVNGQPVGQSMWTGGGKMVQLTFELAAGVLHDGVNQIELTTPPLDGVSEQLCFLHSLSADYTKALNGSQPLDIFNRATQAQLFAVNRLPSADAWVVDARFPDRAALVPYETQLQQDGTYNLRFMAPTGGSGKYLIVPAGLENRPLSVTRRVIKAAPSAAYLATGPSQFSAGVQPLLQLRAKEGLRGTFVDQEQLFDYYNFGRFGPTGIQSAVRALRPKYLLLLGRTTYDYRNYSGLNVDPLCPTFLVSTTFWSQATSDALFGDLGRGTPEVAVGRLPVNDSAELRTAVARVTGYKGMASSALRLHAVADRYDPDAGDFAAQSDTLAQNNPDFAWQRNYLGVTFQSSEEVTAAMTAAANGGADVLLYIGHGNALRLGKDSPRILDTDSVQNWTGNAVFLQSTCTANWMAKNETGYRSIAIQALTQPQGGISASIASSTYMQSDHAVEFMNQLLAHATAGRSRWGDALLKAQQAAFQKGGGFYTDLGTTEQLFGDPAMPVFQTSKSSGMPTSAGSF